MIAIMSSLVRTRTSIEVSGRELAVDTVATHFAEVVALLGEEEVGDNLAGAGIVWRLGVAQLFIDIIDGFVLDVGLVAFWRVLKIME